MKAAWWQGRLFIAPETKQVHEKVRISPTGEANDEEYR